MNALTKRFLYGALAVLLVAVGWVGGNRGPTAQLGAEQGTWAITTVGGEVIFYNRDTGTVYQWHIGEKQPTLIPLRSAQVSIVPTRERTSTVSPVRLPDMGIPTTVQGFRDRFPEELEGFSDQEIADVVYESYFSNVSREVFDSRFLNAGTD